MNDKTTDWQLIEQTGTEAAERARWRAVLEQNIRRDYVQREYPISTAQGIKSKADKTSRTGRADDALRFLQYVALAAAFIFTMAACAGFFT